MDKRRPLVATDTGEPLVVLGGYEVVAGGDYRRLSIDTSTDGKPRATDADRQTLAHYGPIKLVEMGLWGVIDRLKTSGEWQG